MDDSQTQLFNIEDFVRPDAKQVINERTVTVRSHTRVVRPAAVRKAITTTKSSAPETVKDETTVAEARVWLEERVAKGVACPVCTRYAKVYTRTITATMAKALILIYRFSKGEYVHVDKFLMKYGLHSGAAMPALLRHWELLEKKPAKKEKLKNGSNSSGYYRITSRGSLFAQNKVAINRYVRLYDDRSLFLENEDKILIVDALRKQFNYDELMSGDYDKAAQV